MPRKRLGSDIIMGCGHHIREVVSSDEGTTYCGACVRATGVVMDKE